MSLFESKDSSGDISLIDMFNLNPINKTVKEKTIEEIAYLIVRGGWAKNLNTKDPTIMPKYYLDSILHSETKMFNKKPLLMQRIIKSIARNESTIVNNQTIINDVLEESSRTDEFSNLTRITVNSYLEVLNELFLLILDPSYSFEVRSNARISKSPKYHLVDPSLSCAILKLNVNSLIKNPKVFGFMFEALVERDLRIYCDAIEAKLYHFRNNSSGLEMDAIIEFEDNSYACIEIKLKWDLETVEECLKKFKKFNDFIELNNSKNSKKINKPKFYGIICGINCPFIKYLEKENCYIIPITSLKPY